MAEYINIKGQNIEVVASDPANPTQGQIWYNSTSNTLKGGGFQAAAWATGNNMNTARYYIAGCGIQTAALGFGGYSPALANVTSTENYNGSVWTNSPASLSVAVRRSAGAGSNTAALSAGGYSTTYTGRTRRYLLQNSLQKSAPTNMLSLLLNKLGVGYHRNSSSFFDA